MLHFARGQARYKDRILEMSCFRVQGWYCEAHMLIHQ